MNRSHMLHIDVKIGSRSHRIYVEKDATIKDVKFKIVEHDSDSFHWETGSPYTVDKMELWYVLETSSHNFHIGPKEGSHGCIVDYDLPTKTRTITEMLDWYHLKDIIGDKDDSTFMLISTM